jgi:lipopolysaccharide transport system ATP-binding protein
MLLRNHLTRFFTGQKDDPFFALKHVSFSVERGESLAVIGSNGAGKSTLLGLVAGISKPDEGTVAVNGQVTALLELGSGFHPSLTGRENVRLNAA